VEADLARGDLVLGLFGQAQRQDLLIRRPGFNEVVGEVGRHEGSNGRYPQLTSWRLKRSAPRACNGDTPAFSKQAQIGRQTLKTNCPPSGPPGPTLTDPVVDGDLRPTELEVFEASPGLGKALNPRAQQMLILRARGRAPLLHCCANEPPAGSRRDVDSPPVPRPNRAEARRSTAQPRSEIESSLQRLATVLKQDRRSSDRPTKHPAAEQRLVIADERCVFAANGGG